MHMKMLFDIWFHFFPNDKNIDEIDKKWRKLKINLFHFINIVNIGFQGKDPLTDFRGSGLLGLRHLFQFTITDQRVDNVFKVATSQKTWYFFAATGINITGKVIQFIEESNCDKFFYDNYDKINLLQFTHLLYSEFFYGFNQFWVKGKYNDIMMVNSLIEEFMDKKAGNIFLNEIVNKKLF